MSTNKYISLPACLCLSVCLYVYLWANIYIIYIYIYACMQVCCKCVLKMLICSYFAQIVGYTSSSSVIILAKASIKCGSPIILSLSSLDWLQKQEISLFLMQLDDLLPVIQIWVKLNITEVTEYGFSFLFLFIT